MEDLFPAAEFTGVTSGERDKWLAERRTMLTASGTAALFGKHPFVSLLDLYVEKVTDNPPKEVITIYDPRFWGLALEQCIFETVANYYGWHRVPGGKLLRSKKHATLGATLDGNLDQGRGWEVYEGKTTSAWRAKDWNEETGDAPTHVIIQTQHQLLVTGAERVVVFCLVGGQKPVKVEMEAVPEMHAAIIEESERFFESVRTLDPPPPTGTEGDERALRKLYPTDDGSTVRLPKEAVEWARELANAAQVLASAKRRYRHYNQLIKHAMGKATYGVLPEPVDGKLAFRCMVEPRAAHEVEASEPRILRMMKHPPKGTPPVHALPEAVDGLVAQLEESVERAELPNITKIRFGSNPRKRRNR